MTNDTIKIQMRTADEVRATNRVVLYKDGCEREFCHPVAEWDWCRGCKERDEENHCCHRWSNTIRNTVAELEEYYGRHITKTDQTLVIDYPDTDDIQVILLMDDEGFTRVFEERKEGKWIHDIHYGLKLPEHRCSICGEWEYSDTESKYCPNCGARMKGETNEDRRYNRESVGFEGNT